MRLSGADAARTFIDTQYVIALVNEFDEAHDRALGLASQFHGKPLLTTEAILLEVGNSLARGFKDDAIAVIEQFIESDEVLIVLLTRTLFDAAFDLYRSRQDKEWGLIDCISFVVMRDFEVSKALTNDRHFIQAGFQALLRQEA